MPVQGAQSYLDLIYEASIFWPFCAELISLTGKWYSGFLLPWNPLTPPLYRPRGSAHTHSYNQLLKSRQLPVLSAHLKLDPEGLDPPGVGLRQQPGFVAGLQGSEAICVRGSAGEERSSRLSALCCCNLCMTLHLCCSLRLFTCRGDWWTVRTIEGKKSSLYLSVCDEAQQKELSTSLQLQTVNMWRWRWDNKEVKCSDAKWGSWFLSISGSIEVFL